MENVFFYTFSTIAQSLAALIGMLGAFTLFRVQSIDNELRLRADKFANTFTLDVDDHKKIYTLIVNGRYSDSIKAIDEYLLHGSHKTTFSILDKASFAKMKMLVEDRKSIVNSLKIAFGSSALIILLSILMLCITPLIHQTRWPLVLGALAFLICVALQFCLIYKILKK